MKLFPTGLVTFCRLRSVEQSTEAQVRSRRSEGTTTIEVQASDRDTVQACLAAGVLPVSSDAEMHDVAAWVVAAQGALDLSSRGVEGWRITVEHGRSRAETIDALARSGAPFLRTARSRVGEAADICALPSLDAVPSVFVDSVGKAVAAVESGARDLLLRDWDTEAIGELRDALGDRLAERSAFPVGLAVDQVRPSLTASILKTYLDLVDATGHVRPRYEWAPGAAVPPPLNPHRLSAQWPDALWTSGSGPGIAKASPDIAAILDRSLSGYPPTDDETVRLLGARGKDVDAIAAVANQIRYERVGDRVTYVINRNINYTNVCYFRCGFCAFSKGPRSLNLRGDPYLMSIEEVTSRSVEALERGATEVCLQGGIHPSFTGEFYVDAVSSIKKVAPTMHVHGFTPLEVWQGAETLGMTVRSFLAMLKDAGLGTLPGTAAEILDDRIRQYLCPDKIRTSQWAEVMITAHELGIRSTSTIMFGHIDDPASWAAHLGVIKAIQRRTSGFTEFVPLPFVHMAAPIYLRGRARPGPTWDEVVLVHAVARLALDGLIPNIQASWVKLGMEGAARLLSAGCNDFGGTLMNETISRAAGASHGQEVSEGEFRAAIRGAGRTPQQRNTLYGALEGRAQPVGLVRG